MQFAKRYLQALSESQKVLLISIEIIIGLALSVLSLAIFEDLSDYALQTHLGSLDGTLLRAAINSRTPSLTSLMLFITQLGGTIFLSLAILIVSLALLKKHKKETALFLITMIMGVVLNVGLKIIFSRERPQLSPLITQSSKSFPSGHAMNSFVFYSLLTYLTYHLSKNKKLSIATGTLAAIIIGLIGLSRVYLGVHYPSDVIAGYIAGFWWLVTILSVAHSMVLLELFMPQPTLWEQIIAWLEKIWQEVKEKLPKH